MLRTPEFPIDMLERVAEAAAPVLAHVSPDEMLDASVELDVALPCWVVLPDSPARDLGFWYQQVVSDDVPAACILWREHEGRVELAQAGFARLAEGVGAAVAIADAAAEDADYEARVLLAPDRHVTAVWLTGDEDVVVVATAPPGGPVSAGDVRPAADFFAALSET